MNDLSEVSSKRRAMAQIGPLLAVGALGATLAVAAWVAVAAWEQRLAKAKFNDVAGDYATVLQHGLDQYFDKIRALRAFYDASVGVERHEFTLFTSQILTGYRDTMRLVWLPLVRADERAAMEAEARANGLADFTITSWRPEGPVTREPERKDYFPILYSTISYAKTATYGTDLNSEPVRSRAIGRARDDDIMAIAQDIQLRNPIAGKRRGFLAFLPVYKPGLPHSNVVSRRRNLIGIIGGVFQTATVFNDILDKVILPQNVDLYLYPQDENAEAAPMYSRQAFGEGGSAEPLSKATLADLPHWSGPILAGDTRWDLFVVPAKAGFISYQRAWLAGASIILVFAAVLAYLGASLRHTRRLEKANTRILQLAQTDILTSLANRRAFMRRLTMAFAASARGAPPFAVLYLDIDDFKDVNDTLGHAMGDKLLRAVVERLKGVVRDEDLVARFGGDEFAVLTSNVTDPADAGTLAARIGEALAQTFVIDGHKISVTSSIGIALYSEATAGPDALMVQADLALYGAKDDGRNCYRFHSENLDREVHERVRVADELRAAIEHGELELYYQPQVELATGRVTGLEALVRWNHKTRGLLTPASFVPIAERTGAVLPLGSWVFEEACRQMKVWQADGLAPDVLAVNISGVQLKTGAELEREIESSLVRWDVDPSDIELELTESVLMDVTQRHSNTLENLRRLGTMIAIDDFGTGYSSLKYLTTYPVNRLKLAQEFVFRVTVDYRNAAVVRAAIRLAHELGLDVIAEGVETEAQMRFLIGAGCEQAQGYYFSRPVRAAEATVILREGRIAPPAAKSQFTSAA